MGTGLIPADGEIWRVRRRVIVPALHLKVSLSHISLLLFRIKYKKNSSVFDYFHWFVYYSIVLSILPITSLYFESTML